jgi:broad specificity phosphatase PhoE
MGWQAAGSCRQLHTSQGPNSRHSRRADLVLVAHGHPLRALTVRWLRLHPDGGRPFRPATGTLSTRGVERSQPVILSP